MCVCVHDIYALFFTCSLLHLHHCDLCLTNHLVFVQSVGLDREKVTITDIVREE